MVENASLIIAASVQCLLFIAKEIKLDNTKVEFWGALLLSGQKDCIY